jgi:hypothetical protein
MLHTFDFVTLCIIMTPPANHADRFYPILTTRSASNNAPTYLEFVTEREWDRIDANHRLDTRRLKGCLMTYTGASFVGASRYNDRVILHDFGRIDVALEAVATVGTWGANFRMPH